LVINNNSAFLQIKRRQKPPFLGSDHENPDFVALCRSFGIAATRVAGPAELEPALSEALAANERGEPRCVEVVTTSDIRYATPDLYFAQA
jgi:acetolactate synthase-1/2/3 large subunit